MICLTISDEIVPAIYSLNIKQRFGDVGCVLSCGVPCHYLDHYLRTHPLDALHAIVHNLMGRLSRTHESH
jgi:hypothetical protein